MPPVEAFDRRRDTRGRHPGAKPVASPRHDCRTPETARAHAASRTEQQVRGAGHARRRRHGHGLRRDRPHHRTPRGHQGGQAPRRERRRGGRGACPFPPRGAGRRPAVAPQHRRRLRLWRERPRRLDRDGAGRGQKPQGPARQERTLHHPRHRADHGRGLRRPGLFAPARRGAPGHQARQHHDDDRRPGEDRRFRHRPAREFVDDAGRHADRHAVLHGARAVPRRTGRPARRHLVLRRHAVPAADRGEAVRGRLLGRDAQGAAHRTAAAIPAVGHHAAWLRRSDRARAGQAAGRPVPLRRRIRRRHPRRGPCARRRGRTCRAARAAGPERRRDHGRRAARRRRHHESPSRGSAPRPGDAHRQGRADRADRGRCRRAGGGGRGRLVLRGRPWGRTGSRHRGTPAPGTGRRGSLSARGCRPPAGRAGGLRPRGCRP
ncbi:hypothetical protein ROS9278_03452 [Roseomonas sp. CECT 9278]|nr:hypothetical protein ROS9278_03452 [Roseomonas sp. CECT 9278]